MRIQKAPLLEHVPLAGPTSVAVREFKPAAFTHAWHQHPELELTWILKGSGLRYVGDSVKPFHPGDFCLLGSNLPHAWLSPADEKGPVRSLVIQFDPARWGSAFLNLPEFVRIAGLFERASRGLCFPSSLGTRLRSRLLRNPSPLGRFAALLEILEELAASSDARPIAFAPQPLDRRIHSDPRTQKVLAFLSKNSAGPIAHKDAARLVRLSPAAFSRFFRRTVGKTFGAYLTDLRLSDACRRLLESDRTISQIAFESGFENLSTFNRSFRKAREISPRDFRRRALGAG